MVISETPEHFLADVFITDELTGRAPKKTDYFQEKLALQDLAARMADHPDEVLPRFVELAMRMTGSASAGISLYEEYPIPGVFRWAYVRGVLSPLEGTATPRDFSPCGLTLDGSTPVLLTHPERVYTWIADANISVPEVLLVPMYLQGQVPVGTLWVVSGEAGHFDSGHARVLTEITAFVGIALRMKQTAQRLQRTLNEQEILAGEMSHRVKNLFAVTESIVQVSARGAATKEEMARLLSGRLRALATAHTLIRRNLGEVGNDARVADLGGLIEAVVRPYETSVEEAASRFSLTGPPVNCGDHAINAIALIFYELSTNAVKYGALKNDTGHVDIRWRREGDILAMRWTERGGPPIEAPPTSKGFGSKLAHSTVVRQFQGTLDYDWQSEGLVLTLAVPLASFST